MRQSKRRMQVAQKRLNNFKDVLRRPKVIKDEEVWFWHWFLKAPNDVFLWSYQSFHTRNFQEVGLLGPLSGKQRLRKPLPVRITWDDGAWLVSEQTYHMHAAGPTISKAIASFYRILASYLVTLSEHEGPMSQHLMDQLAYLRDMIEEESQA